MVRLSLQDQIRIVVHFEQGVSQCQIAAQLHYSHTAVQKVVCKYKSTRVQEASKTFQNLVVLKYLQLEKST